MSGVLSSFMLRYSLLAFLPGTLARSFYVFIYSGSADDFDLGSTF